MRLFAEEAAAAEAKREGGVGGVGWAEEARVRAAAVRGREAAARVKEAAVMEREAAGMASAAAMLRRTPAPAAALTMTTA